MPPAGPSYRLSVRGVIVLWTPRAELLDAYTAGGEHLECFMSLVG